MEYPRTWSHYIPRGTTFGLLRHPLAFSLERAHAVKGYFLMPEVVKGQEHRH